MLRESIDIADQIELGRFEPTADLEPSITEGDRQDCQPPLGVELTGYFLLIQAVTFGFGIPMAISSYRGQTVISTTLGWISGTILTALLSYLGLFQAKRPEICPYFFQVDWAPPILKFVRSPELYCSFVSLLSLQPAVALLHFCLTFREDQSVKITPSQFEPADPSFVIRYVVIMAAFCVIPGIFSALQHLTKPIHCLRALHMFLTRSHVHWSFLFVWAVLIEYFCFLVMTSNVLCVLDYRYPTEDMFIGFVMTVAPMILMAEAMELQSCTTSLKVLQIIEVVFGLVYAGYMVVLLVILLSGTFGFRCYSLHLCCFVIFFLHRSLTTLRTLWTPVANLRKIVCSAAD